MTSDPGMLLRCEELGFRLDRHELDHIYRHFIALADATKTVEDGHILELIRQLRPERSRRSVLAESPHTAPGDLLNDGSGPRAAAASISLGPHENEQQEDYLWGV